MLTIQNAGCIRFILQSSDRSKTIRKELDPRKPVNRRRDANQNVIKKSHRRGSERRTENSFFFHADTVGCSVPDRNERVIAVHKLPYNN